jgi:hypothetical protein
MSAPSIAKDPLLGGTSGAVVVADKDLANVKGSGTYANLYGYYGAYYASQAQYYGALGSYYNYYSSTGPNGAATSNFYNAYSYANTAANYYYYAYYYFITTPNLV